MTTRSRRTLVLAQDAHSAIIARKLTRYPKLGYDLVGAMEFPHADWHSRTARLENTIRSRQVDHLLVSSHSLNGSLEYLEDLCRSYRIRLSVFSSDSKSAAVRNTLDTIEGMPLVSLHRGRINRTSIILKRGIDIVGSILLSLLMVPLCAFVAVAAKCESRGPVIFKQRRCLNVFDSPFFLYKFRSMHRGAERDKTGLDNEAKGPLFKMKNDPRVTRLGRFMRRFSIDELPQLYNVMKGDMSLVGPRPLPAEDFARFHEENDLDAVWRLRSRVKPGITGLWQISGRSDLDVREMLLLDLYYIEHQSMLLDLRILARTIPAVLLRRGAY